MRHAVAEKTGCTTADDAARVVESEETMSATIYGKVYNNVTKAVITSAVVTAPPYTVTNNNGNYNFTTPGAATVGVTASATGFSPKTINVTVANGQTKKQDFYLDPL